MKKNLFIWVEGIADQKFLADLMHIWYGLEFKFEKRIFKAKSELLQITLQSTGGITAFTSDQRWKNSIEIDFTEHREQGFADIIILDADDDYNSRRTNVSEICGDYVNQDNLYLWPNNTGNGDLETLLANIINLDNSDIFDCWRNYENCLNSTGKSYTTPARKTKIYAYLEALLGTTHTDKEKIKERERNYQESAHWNLSPEHPELAPLKSFLDRHLIQL